MSRDNVISFVLGFLVMWGIILRIVLFDIQDELRGIREELHSARVVQEKTCEVGDE